MKWKYSDSERPIGKCYDCGLSYKDFVDVEVPDKIWEKINPTYCEGAGLLCPNCIGLRLRSLYLSDISMIYRG